MTRLPQLEAQLVAAAATRPPRAKRPLVFAGGALVAAACVAALLLLVPGSKPRERPAHVAETVPAATLVKARALAASPLPADGAVPDSRLAATARQTMAGIPYPPGVRDR